MVHLTKRLYSGRLIHKYVDQDNDRYIETLIINGWKVV